ncbi:YceI family protein [Pedobacter africanus]|jgi:polyisoprenoid-binding protein YceI|uniref:Polyisoprenoid-binding protein YceI n=1 Tax=Pedobacter africanus TaxID=151894 RepID=A0A1W1ZUH1_9SPHI|nr:YceI family protein [Pedobacter africanus]SMC52125.1 Polyisoprenoid-binding protein YceI [Pedobacter africanus]
MKKLLLAAAVLSTALFAFKSAAPTTWSADTSHSKLGFVVTHLMITDVEGSFKNFQSTITSSKPDFSDAVVELTADVNSVNTDNEKRDEHLKGADFFDAAKYPKLTFKSTSVKKVSGNKYKVSGNLNFHGVTKPVVLDATLRGVTTNPMSKKPTAGFKVSGTIKRADFGFGTKYGNAMLSDEVTLNANTEFVQN